MITEWGTAVHSARRQKGPPPHFIIHLHGYRWFVVTHEPNSVSTSLKGSRNMHGRFKLHQNGTHYQPMHTGLYKQPSGSAYAGRTETTPVDSTMHLRTHSLPCMRTACLLPRSLQDSQHASEMPVRMHEQTQHDAESEEAFVHASHYRPSAASRAAPSVLTPPAGWLCVLSAISGPPKRQPALDSASTHAARPRADGPSTECRLMQPWPLSTWLMQYISCA